MMPIRHSPWPVPHSVKIVDMIKRKIRVKIGHNILNKTILEFENLRKQGMNRAALFRSARTSCTTFGWFVPFVRPALKICITYIQAYMPYEL